MVAYVVTWIAIGFAIAAIIAALYKRYRMLQGSAGLMFVLLGIVTLLDFKPVWFALFSFVLLVLVGSVQMGLAIRRTA